MEQFPRKLASPGKGGQGYHLHQSRKWCFSFEAWLGVGTVWCIVIWEPRLKPWLCWCSPGSFGINLDINMKSREDAMVGEGGAPGASLWGLTAAIALKLCQAELSKPRLWQEWVCASGKPHCPFCNLPPPHTYTHT